MPRTLLVDDDEIVREIVAAGLAVSGIEPVQVESASAALAAAAARPFDLALIDVNLSDGNGFDVAAALRRQRDVAVIFVTADPRRETRLFGLRNGGDDYMTKPVDVPELLARIDAVMRRYRRSRASNEPGERVIALGGWTLDLLRRELADTDGRIIRLTRAEFDLFAALYQASPIPLARDYLVEVIASADAAINERTVDVMVSRIRGKLEKGTNRAPRIVTRRGEGYVLVQS